MEEAPCAEIYSKSINARNIMFKIHSVGYNAVADNTGVPSFV